MAVAIAARMANETIFSEPYLDPERLREGLHAFIKTMDVVGKAVEGNLRASPANYDETMIVICSALFLALVLFIIIFWVIVLSMPSCEAKYEDGVNPTLSQLCWLIEQLLVKNEIQGTSKAAKQSGSKRPSSRPDRRGKNGINSAEVRVRVRRLIQLLLIWNDNQTSLGDVFKATRSCPKSPSSTPTEDCGQDLKVNACLNRATLSYVVFNEIRRTCDVNSEMTQDGQFDQFIQEVMSELSAHNQTPENARRKQIEPDSLPELVRIVGQTMKNEKHAPHNPRQSPVDESIRGVQRNVKKLAFDPATNSPNFKAETEDLHELNFDEWGSVCERRCCGRAHGCCSESRQESACDTSERDHALEDERKLNHTLVVHVARQTKELEKMKEQVQRLSNHHCHERCKCCQSNRWCGQHRNPKFLQELCLTHSTGEICRYRSHAPSCRCPLTTRFDDLDGSDHSSYGENEIVPPYSHLNEATIECCRRTGHGHSKHTTCLRHCDTSGRAHPTAESKHCGCRFGGCNWIGGTSELPHQNKPSGSKCHQMNYHVEPTCSKHPTVFTHHDHHSTVHPKRQMYKDADQQGVVGLTQHNAEPQPEVELETGSPQQSATRDTDVIIQHLQKIENELRKEQEKRTTGNGSGSPMCATSGVETLQPLGAGAVRSGGSCTIHH